MSKSKPKIDVVLYYMSLHYGVVMDMQKVFRISAQEGEKEIWSGEATDNQTISINDQELFGGLKQEGGVQGDMHMLFGGPSQELTSYQAGKVNRTFENCPGYRGLFTILFTETPGLSLRDGFFWQANSPTVPPIAVEGENIYQDWQPLLAKIPRDGSESADSQLSEVATGEYSLDGLKTGNNGFDWEGRRWFGIANGGTDVLYIRSMADHSTISSHNINWNGQGTGQNVLAWWDATASLLHVLTDTGRLAAMGDDGVVVSTSSTTDTGSDAGPTSFMPFTVNDVQHFASVKFSGLFNWRIAITKYEGGVYTDLGDFGVASTTAPTFHNFRIDGASTYLYWRDGNDIREGTMTGAGIGALRVIWTPGFSWNDGFYDPGRGNMVLRDNARARAYEFDNETFALQWTNNNAAVLTTTPFATAWQSRFTDQMATIGPTFGNSMRIISLVDGTTIETPVANSGMDNTNWIGVYDQIGGATWGSNNGNQLHRWQGTPGIIPGTATRFDHNPAHMIRELTINADFGAGAPTATLDDAAFIYAAQTFFDEGLGLSTVWSRQTSVEEFIREILDHCNAVYYQDPRTGLIRLVPIRGDYTVGTLQEINNRNAELISHDDKALVGDTVNEIVVNFTYHETEENESVSIQDAANVELQGKVVTEERSYPMVRTFELAQQLCRREIRTAAYPLKSFRFLLNAEFWDARPADVFKLTWQFPDKDDGTPGDTITDMAVRVIDPRSAFHDDGRVEVFLTQDIFALEVGDFTTVAKPDTTTPGQDPTELEYIRTFSLNAYFLQNFVAAAGDLTEPEAMLGFVLATTNDDAYEVTVVARETTDALGNTVSTETATLPTTARGTFDAALAQEAQTTIAGGVTTDTNGVAITVGGFLLIGDTEATEELVAVSAVTPDLVLERGILDTVPREWPAGTPFYVLNENIDIVDNEEYTAPDTITYRFLPRTQRGRLDLADASDQNLALTDRAYQPYRPANIAVEGIAFGSVAAEGLTNLTVDWANRNRLTEDSVLDLWGDGDVTPEASQTVTIQALDINKVFIDETTGLTGTTHEFPVSKWAGAEEGYIRILAERGSYESFQSLDLHVAFVNLMLVEPGGAGSTDYMLLPGGGKIKLPG